MGIKVSVAGGAWAATPGDMPSIPASLSRAVPDLATLAPRARKGSRVTPVPPGPSHGMPMAQWWSRSLVPRGHQARTEPLAGMESP